MVAETWVLFVLVVFFCSWRSIHAGTETLLLLLLLLLLLSFLLSFLIPPPLPPPLPPLLLPLPLLDRLLFAVLVPLVDQSNKSTHGRFLPIISFTANVPRPYVFF